jgi:hypothetical protein
MADVYVEAGSCWVLMKMPLCRDAVRNYAAVPKDNSRVTHGPIPTPAALIPGRFLVNPLFDRDAIALFSTLAEGRANRAQHLCVRHAYCDAIGRLRRGLASRQ